MRAAFYLTLGFGTDALLWIHSNAFKNLVLRFGSRDREEVPPGFR